MQLRSHVFLTRASLVGFSLIFLGNQVRRSRRGRRLLTTCSAILGDTNGDCTFDVEDVQQMQYYIGGAVDAASLSAQQLAAMDPDLDGDSDGVDISYLMKVVANKYRFLANFSSLADPFSLYATVWTSTSAAASASSTEVAFEIGTSLNQVRRRALWLLSYRFRGASKCCVCVCLRGSGGAHGVGGGHEPNGHRRRRVRGQLSRRRRQPARFVGLCLLQMHANEA